MSKPKVLFWDLETSLQLAAIFGLAHNDWIAPENLVTERSIICGSWKWEGKEKVHSVSVLDDPKRYAKDPHDDYFVVKKLHEVMSEADVIVAHNGDNFDKRYLDTRILIHGLPALPPIMSVDTYKVAKSKLLFNSNKLDYIGRMLKVGKKIHTSPGLWLRVLNGEASAVKEMVTYNKQDVILLEKVYDKLKPYIPNHVNRELFGGMGCPRCESTHIQSRGLHRAVTRVYRRWQCQDCAGWFRTQGAEKGSTTKYRVL